MPAMNATSANNPRLPAIERTEAIRARIAAFCARFEVEPVKLTVRKGQVHMTDDLLGWFKATGASIDWIILGDPMPMAAHYRTAHLQEREFLELMAEYSDEESKMLTAALTGCFDTFRARRAKIRAEAQAVEQT